MTVLCIKLWPTYLYLCSSSGSKRNTEACDKIEKAKRIRSCSLRPESDGKAEPGWVVQAEEVNLNQGPPLTGQRDQCRFLNLFQLQFIAIK
jgi:hypothetical protein